MDRLRIAIVGLVFFCGTMGSAVASRPLQLKVTCYVKDSLTGQVLSARSVTVVVVPPPQDLRDLGGYFYFTKSYSSGEDVKKVEISIVAKEGYKDRLIRLRRTPGETQSINRVVNAFVVSTGEQIDWNFYDRGRKFIDQVQWERAFSVFEYIFEQLSKPDDETEFNIASEFNYARSALELCKQGYDTCQLAEELYRKVQNMCSNEPKLCGKLRISGTALSNGPRVVNELKDKEREAELINGYRAALKDVWKGKNYESATSDLEFVWKTYDANSATWLANGKPKWAVAEDTGLAYFRYAINLPAGPESRNAGEKERLLKKSADYYQDAVRLGAPEGAADSLVYVKNELTSVSSKP